MTEKTRRIFLFHGSRPHWKTAQAKSFWGLPRHGRSKNEIEAELQAAGFIPGVEIIGIAGPNACLRAVVGSHETVYFDDVDASFGMDRSNDTYPVRFVLTKIQEINRPWYRIREDNAWKEVLKEVYFSENSMFVIRDGLESDRNIYWQVVLGNDLSSPPGTGMEQAAPPTERTAPQLLEDQTADAIADIGFRVEQLGYSHPYERVPDGIACLPRSLAEYMTRVNDKPFFLLWDSKLDCGPQGLTAAEERAVREYITDFGKQKKLALMIPELWFLLVAPNTAVAERIQHSLDRASWPDDLREFGCKGVRAVTLDWLRSIATKATSHRRAGQDPDDFLGSQVPRMLKTGRME